METFNRIWKRITRRKLVIRKEIGPFKRVFSVENCFTLASSSVLGFEFYDIMRIFSLYGDAAVYSYAFTSAITFLPLLCYAELASIQPCIGGPYHYGYNTTVEIVGFVVGWVALEANLCYNVSMLKGASKMIDEAFFNGIIEKGFREYLGFNIWTIYLAPYPDFLSFILALIFSGIAAAETSETKSLNTALFFVNIVILSILGVVFLGKMNLNLMLKAEDVPMGMLFRGFSSTNSIFNGIVFLTFLGEEAVDADQTIPKSMIWSFLFCSLWLWIFPVLQSLQIHYLHLNRYTPIRSILQATKLASLDFLPMAGVSAAIYNSCYVHMLYSVRLTVAMSRDGLMMHAFSKLEHFNNMPVKPAFLCGLISGIIAVFFNVDSIWACGNVANMTIMLCGPLFVLHQRYMTEIDHIEDKLYRKGTKKPKYYSHYLVWALVFSTILVGISVSELTTHWFINRRMKPRKFLPLLIISCISTAVSLFFLCLQPQNKVNSYFQVWGVPYSSAFTIFLLSFLISYANMLAVYFTGVWVALGLAYYTFIVAKKSKLEDIQLK